MERRYNVIPILAVVVAEEDIDNGAVISILMPFAGLSLESLSMPASDSGALPSGFVYLSLTKAQLRDLSGLWSS
jgi:hypothetical protein